MTTDILSRPPYADIWTNICDRIRLNEQKLRCNWGATGAPMISCGQMQYLKVCCHTYQTLSMRENNSYCTFLNVREFQMPLNQALVPSTDVETNCLPGEVERCAGICMAIQSKTLQNIHIHRARQLV